MKFFILFSVFVSLFAEAAYSPKNVVSSTSRVRVEYAVVGTTSCTADPCTINNKSSGISAINRQSAGTYVVHFSSGVFASLPACTASCHQFNTANAYASGPSSANGTETPSATIFPFNCVSGDSEFVVTCIGTY